MTGTIRFLMDDEIIELDEVDPTRTVLQYLREDIGLTGTKEGCAEGDCGACTVAIGELDGDEINYRAINACIAFLSSLDGKELVTVESLAKDANLHPAQQAMVDCHGTQCGFCTPGFVMSLFVHHEHERPVDGQSIADALAGNLCRCTGYGPILKAAQAMGELPGTGARRVNVEVIEALRGLVRESSFASSYVASHSTEARAHFSPRTRDELTTLLSENPNAKLVAGATDIGLWVTKQHRTLGTTISLAEIAELKHIIIQNGTLTIGAGVTYSEAHAALSNWHPDMGELVRRIGSVQIRNSGTIGGNIANGSPIGDTMPALIAGDASLRLGSADGVRDILLEDYFIAYGQQDLQPGEFVQAVILPALGDDTFFRTYKISKRFDQDISAVCGAFALTISEKHVTTAQIAYGGMAATPKRAFACERALVGSELSGASIEAAMVALAQDFTPISDMRASESYRLKTAQNMLKRLFIEWQGGTATRVLDMAVSNG